MKAIPDSDPSGPDDAQQEVARLQAEVEQRAKILESVSSHTETHLAYLDADFNFVWVNATYAQRCGRSRDELIGNNHFRFFPDAENQSIFERVRDTGQSYEAKEKPFVFPEHPEWGTSYWNWTLTTVKDGNGRIEGLVLSLLEVTDAVNARREIDSVRAQAEQRAAELQIVFSSLTDAYIIFDALGNVVTANETTKRIYGFDPHGMRRDELLTSLKVHSSTGEPVAFNDLPSSKALRGELVVSEKQSFTDASGNSVTVLVSAAPLLFEGSITGAVTTLHDITDLERAEQSLRLTQFSVDHAADRVFWIAPDASFIYVNDAACRSLGYSRQELLSMTVFDIDPDFPVEGWHDVWEQLRTKTVLTFETRHKTKDGRAFPVEIIANFMEFGGVEYDCAFARDISARKQIEREQAQHLERLDTLIKVSTEVLEETEVYDLLQRVVDAARQVTKARLGISGHGHSDGAFRVGVTSRAAEAPPCPPGDTMCVIRGGIYLEIIEHGNSIRFTAQELEKHPAWWGLPEGHTPLRGLLGAPLVNVDGRPNGLIMVSDKEGGDFNVEDEAALSQLAIIASLGLQHLEARDELKQMYEHEERIADVLQRALIPEISLNVPNYDMAGSYLPALAEAEVGGDFYDAFELWDGRIALVLGDVAGKGLNAAVYTATCKNILRGFAVEMPSPVITLNRLDKALQEILPESEFITLVYALLDPKTGEIKYASGGHEPAIVYRAETGIAAPFHAPGHALGSGLGVDFEEKTLQLGEGDMLIIYTDGISDAGRPDNYFGPEGIAFEAIEHIDEPLKPLMTHILNEANLREQGDRSDDKALLIIRRKKRSIETADYNL